MVVNPLVDVGASVAQMAAELRGAWALAFHPPSVDGLARYSDVGRELVDIEKSVLARDVAERASRSPE